VFLLRYPGVALKNFRNRNSRCKSQFEWETLMKKLLSISLTAIALGLVVPIAHADNTAITLTSSSDSSGTYSLGFTFSPTANIDVTSLGSYFGPNATDQQGVSVWDSSQNLLASTTVTGDGSATEGFQFVNITPIELLAGQTYTISAATNGDNYAITNGGGAPGDGFNVGSDITYLAHVETSCSGSNACFPSGNYGTSFADFGANFTYTGGANSPVPEPSTFLMLGSGLAGMAGMLRRKFTRG
jgi:hypothetical protein